MRHYFLFVLFIMLALFCDNRTDPISSRNNPYDSGGDNFRFNSVPTVTGSADSVWHDYNHETGYGSIKLSFSVDDLNLPSDSVTCRFIFGSTTIATHLFSTKCDSSIIISDLLPSETYICSLQVSDLYDSTALAIVSIKTPVLLPPLAPKPEIVTDTNPIIIKWKAVAAAQKYVIYGSETKNGPFLVDTTVVQPSSGPNTPISVSRLLDKTGSRFYIVSSKNSSGESLSSDTLYARLYSDDIAVPTIDSVSSGTYTDYISISWKPVTTKISTYDIYRSESLNGPYILISTVKNVTAPTEYHDSVTTSSIYYYKIASILNNRSSKLSEPKSGFIFYSRIPINLTIQSNSTLIGLYWDPVMNVTNYIVYRSSTSCQKNSVRIGSTSASNYFDTVASATTYYYSVVGENDDKKPIAESECISGTTGILSAPTGIQITNTSVSSIIKWDSLPGACSYVIFRSLSGCSDNNNQYQTTMATMFKDTVNTDKIRYYKIAAVDNAGRKGIFSNCIIGSTKMLSSPTGLVVSYGTYPTKITLRWAALTGAKSYVIYRSATSCESQSKLATVNTTEYSDDVSSTAIYYYSVAGIDEMGTEGSLSECSEGRARQLAAPTNVIASYDTYSNGISISWDAISETVSGYIVYRGTSVLEPLMSPIDTVVTLTHFDTILNDSKVYYYRIAAYNSLGVGQLSQYASGRTTVPPDIYTINYSGTIAIYWTYNKSYTMTYLYRSSDSATFICQDSTSGDIFYNTPSDFARYYYLVDFKLDNGEIVRSKINYGYRTLSAPVNLEASDLDNGVYLKWESTPGATSYVIYRSLAYSSTEYYTEVTGINFTDVSTNKNRYNYQVSAKNMNTESEKSNTVQGGMQQTPAIPYISVYGTSSAIILNITPDSYGSAPDGYQIYRSATNDGKFMLIDSTNSTIYYDSVPDFKVYYYRITAYNKSGTSNFSEVQSAYRLPPDAPTGLIASNGISKKYIKLTWSSVANVTGYYIYRRISSSGTLEKIATTSLTEFIDSTVGEYYSGVLYNLTSYIDSTESGYSGAVYGYLFGPPGYVGASANLYGISLSWGSRKNAAKYYIYRSASADGEFILIDSSATTRYSDTNELKGNNCYKIASVSSDGEISALSKPSDVLTRTYPTAPTNITATEGTDSLIVSVVWNKVTAATGYKVYRSTSDTFTAANMLLLKTIDTTAFSDTVQSDSIYYYKIKAFNKGGESSLSDYSARGFRTPKLVPAQPISLDTIANTESIHLEWKMPSKTIAYTGFKVYRSNVEAGPYTLITSINSYAKTEYFDKTPETYPTIYWYKVAAFNQKGEGPLTDSVSGAW